MEQAMRKMITILASALLASSLAIAQADARGGGGGGHGGGMGGGFGGGAHIGGFGGGAHVGGIGVGSVAGLGAAHIGGGVGQIGGIRRFEGSRTAVGENAHVGGIRQHAMHRLDRIYPYYGYGVDCYDWYLSHPADTEPPYCG
jgi:hypothetical protein